MSSEGGFADRDGGHEVGNHYFGNGPTLLDSDAESAGNLAKTEKALAISDGRKLFSLPGGMALSRHLRIARAKGYECVLGCAYPHDPMRLPVWHIERLIVKNLRSGAL